MHVHLSGFPLKMTPNLVESFSHYHNADVSVSPTVALKASGKTICCVTDFSDGDNLVNISPQEKDAYLKYDTSLVAAKIAIDTAVKYKDEVTVQLHHGNEVTVMDYFKALRAMICPHNQQKFLETVWEKLRDTSGQEIIRSGHIR